MNLELFVYPNKGVVLKGTRHQLKTLIEKEIIKETDNGCVLITQPIKLSVFSIGDESLDTFVKEQFLPLFPTIMVNSGSSSYRVNGNAKEALKALKEFIVAYKDRYNFDCIYAATSAYLYEKSLVNFNYTLKTHNFIRKELESWCLAYENNPDEVIKKAKLYYEYARRTATRTRKRLIESDGFLRQSILGGGDDNGGRGDSESTDGCKYIQPGGIAEIKSKAIRINKSHKK